MATRLNSNLQQAAQKAGAKTDIDFEFFEWLHHQRKAMRAASKASDGELDEVAGNMARIYDLLLKHGRFFQPSARPRQYKAGDRNQCYGNSLELVLACEDLSYCEGYVVVKGSSIPAEHGWCITQQDNVVDVTLRKPLRPLAYFGVVFNPLFAASRDLPAIESVLIEKAKPASWRARV